MSFNKFWIKEAGVEYDEARRRAAGQKAIIYYLVALYVGYMGYSIMSNRLSGDDTMSFPLATALTLVLIIGALGVAWYATKRMRNEFINSKIEDTNKEEKQN